ncbi:MAG: hypothetical protein LBC77_00050 [Spirochaetaceae bacterium]|nr:hypothetical protein [Spirochaetaceae bacterium]
MKNIKFYRIFGAFFALRTKNRAIRSNSPRCALRIPLLSLALVRAALFAQTGAPSWYLERALDFSDGEYISGAGSGRSEVEAKSRALGEILQYFKTSAEVESEILNEYERAIGAGAAGGRTGKSAARESIVIRSEEELLAVRYAESWFDAARGLWHSCCYINKAEARYIAGRAHYVLTRKPSKIKVFQGRYAVSTKTEFLFYTQNH